MDEWIDIPEAAQILKTTETKARVLLNHFNVRQEDGTPSRRDGSGRPFGSPPRMYLKADVVKLAELSIA